MTSRTRLTATWLGLAIFCISPHCQADVILSPGSVLASTIGPLNGNYTVSSGIDQSGLSAGYTSGVTDFDSYIASNPTHVHSGLNTHFLSSVATAGSVDFDLGDVYSLESVAVWNWNNSQGGVGLRQLEVFTSADATFSSPVSQGIYGIALDGSSLAKLADLITPVNTQFVRLQIDNLASGRVGFAEVAFDVTAVPEPSSLALLVLGITVPVVRSRRKKVRLAA